MEFLLCSVLIGNVLSYGDDPHGLSRDGSRPEQRAQMALSGGDPAAVWTGAPSVDHGNEIPLCSHDVLGVHKLKDGAASGNCPIGRYQCGKGAVAHLYLAVPTDDTVRVGGYVEEHPVFALLQFMGNRFSDPGSCPFQERSSGLQPFQRSG